MVINSKLKNILHVAYGKVIIRAQPLFIPLDISDDLNFFVRTVGFVIKTCLFLMRQKQEV